MKRVLIGSAVVLACAAMVWVFAGAFGKDVRAVPFGLKGKPAPAFTLPRLDAPGKITMAEFKGKPVILNVWASWCGPCKMEHPVIEWGARRFGKNVQFLGLVFEDKPNDARAFLSRNGSEFPQMYEDGTEVAIDYGVAGVPETYFIDANGIIVDKHVGPMTPEQLAAGVARIASTHPASVSGRRKP